MVTTVVVVFKMDKFLIVVIAAIAGCQAGYIYPRPYTQFSIPANIDIKQQNTNHVKTQLHQTTVAYSVPFEEYTYLKNHKSEYHTSPFNDLKALEIFESNSSELESLTNDKAVTGTIKDDQVIPGTINKGVIENQSMISKENLNGGKAKFQPTGPLIFDNTVVSADEIPVLKELVGTIDSRIQSKIHQIDNIYANEPRAQTNLAQHVTKHISFHVPPPEIEEPQVVRIAEPPKKTYKIIFIKVPSQDTSNKAQIQQALYNQIAPVEDKTLIYVLVKKPEEVQFLPPPPSKPSEHQVLFVNYKNARTPLPIGTESFLE